MDYFRIYLHTKILYANEKKKFVCIMPYTLFTLTVTLFYTCVEKKKLTINAVFILNEDTAVLC